ncbi:MAG: ABC transporter ATP-binding protein, partial [Aeriscardovia aeriphila]|nr:ABC transporter ATP-binding protein [Aeriscardovia aeriphila]
VRLFRHVLALPLSYHDEHESGEVSSHVISDITVLRSFVATVLPRSLSGGLAGIVMVVMIAVLDWPTLLFLIASLGLLIGSMSMLMKNYEKFSEQTQKAISSLSAVVTDSLRSIRAIKENNAEKQVGDKAEKTTHDLLSVNLSLDRLNARLTPLEALAQTLWVVAIVLWVIMRQVYGGLSAANIVAIVLYAQQLVQPVNQVYDLLTSMKTTRGSLRTVLAMLEIPQEDAGHNEAELQLSHAQAQVQPQEQGKGLSAQGLELKNVSLQYSSQHTVLQDISLQLKPGEKIAVVGKTGAGKTSIAKVIDRLYPASSGSCMLDGISSEEMPLREWRSRIAIVSQDPGVLTGTIRENLMLGLEKVPSKQAIEQALAISDFQEAMDKENLSLDSALGEEGHNLSGGQRQRLQIARAVLRQPRYLILDEATANLDAKTEEKVLAALRDALPQTGFLVISHRLATIVDSDRIYFIAQGKLLGSGTNEYLKSTFPQYRQLLALQGLDQD